MEDRCVGVFGEGTSRTRQKRKKLSALSYALAILKNARYGRNLAGACGTTASHGAWFCTLCSVLRNVSNTLGSTVAARQSLCARGHCGYGPAQLSSVTVARRGGSVINESGVSGQPQGCRKRAKERRNSELEARQFHSLLWQSFLYPNFALVVCPV
eukprot:290081-Rhodomonas_salina.1